MRKLLALGILILLSYLVFALNYKSPTSRDVATESQDNKCPNEFNYYENNSFAICYPNYLTAKTDSLTQNPSSEEYPEKNVVKFEDKEFNSELVVIPSFFSAQGANKCTTSKAITISGYDAKEIVNKENIGEDCGEINSATTIIKLENNVNFYIIYQAFADGSLRSIEDYETSVKSLEIKSL